jgi:hypothetical protein
VFGLQPLPRLRHPTRLAAAVQTLLGHHCPAFTMDVYSDLWPTALDRIGEHIAATLFSGDGSKVAAETPQKGSRHPDRRASH